MELEIFNRLNVARYFHCLLLKLSRLFIALMFGRNNGQVFPPLSLDLQLNLNGLLVFFYIIHSHNVQMFRHLAATIFAIYIAIIN